MLRWAQIQEGSPGIWHYFIISTAYLRIIVWKLILFISTVPGLVLGTHMFNKSLLNIKMIE